MRPQATPPRQTHVLALCLAVSGAVALVYEVAWQRRFALLFGAAAPATATVLAAYFAGLGCGSWTIGRWVNRWSNPLRVYAWLEIGIAVGACLVSPLLSGFEAIYPTVFPVLSGHSGAQIALRASFAIVALFIPTFCMGGTLPVLGPFVDRGRAQLGVSAGILYIANTVGAAVGALSVPFVLLPSLGLQGSVWLGAAINLVLAVIATALARSAPTKPPERLPTEKDDSPLEKSLRWAMILAFVSGGATFGLQVLWNRGFAQIHENSLQSFAVVVAIVIAALAIGAQLARFGLRRRWSRNRFLGTAWIVGGVSIMGSPLLFLRMSHQMSYLGEGDTWLMHALHLGFIAGALLLVPVALLGVAFPLLMEQIGKHGQSDSGLQLGRLLAVNVLGSILAAGFFGFVTPRWIGLWKTIVWLGVLLLAIGCGVFFAPRSAAKKRLLTLGLIALCAAASVPLSHLDWPRVSLSGPQEKLLAVSEGAYGIVAVVERPGSRRLKLNNHYGLGGTGSTGDERMQAHIPLLLHPAPQHIAFLGLGTGITAGGALGHPIGHITVMELVPEVVTAARDFFPAANHRVIEDPRVRVIADDARHALRVSSEKYDVIIGDLVVPWRQGEGDLFVLEQFHAARAALAPGGLFCQWVPAFQLSPDEFVILAQTFLHAFPHVQIWRGDFSPNQPALALIGSFEEQPLDIDVTERRLREVRPDPANRQLSSADDFWIYYVGDISEADLPLEDQRINTDDRPWIEMLGPRHHAGGATANLFVGRRLQAWLNQVRHRSSLRHPDLLPRINRAVAAGAALEEMTNCMFEENDVGAAAAREKIRALLPADALEKLF